MRCRARLDLRQHVLDGLLERLVGVARGRRDRGRSSVSSRRARSIASRSLSASSSRRTRATSIAGKGSRATERGRTPPPPPGAFGRSRAPRPAVSSPVASSRTRRVTRRPCSRTSCSKSRIVQRWMLGVSCQACGSRARDGHPAPHGQVDAVRPVADVAERHDAGAARRGASRTAPPPGGAWPAARCDRITTSKEPSSNSATPSSMSACTTGTPRATQAKKPSSEASMPLTEQPRSAARCASRAPSPEPRSSTREPRGTSSATIARSVRSAGLLRHPVEEGGDGAVVLGHRAAGTSRGRAARRSRGT